MSRHMNWYRCHGCPRSYRWDGTHFTELQMRTGCFPQCAMEICNRLQMNIKISVVTIMIGNVSPFRAFEYEKQYTHYFHAKPITSMHTDGNASCIHEWEVQLWQTDVGGWAQGLNLGRPSGHSSGGAPGMGLPWLLCYPLRKSGTKVVLASWGSRCRIQIALWNMCK